MGANYALLSLTAGAQKKALNSNLSNPVNPNKGFIERFNRTYCHEVLNDHIFESLEKVREITEEWIHSYNQDRPHAALGRNVGLTGDIKITSQSFIKI